MHTILLLYDNNPHNIVIIWYIDSIDSRFRVLEIKVINLFVFSLVGTTNVKYFLFSYILRKHDHICYWYVSSLTNTKYNKVGKTFIIFFEVLCWFQHFLVISLRSLYLTDFPGYLTSDHQCLCKWLTTESHMISEWVVRGKWLLDSMLR